MQGHPQLYNQPRAQSRTYEAMSKKPKPNKETEKRKEKEKAVGGEEGRKEGIDLKLCPLRSRRSMLTTSTSSRQCLAAKGQQREEQLCWLC